MIIRRAGTMTNAGLAAISIVFLSACSGPSLSGADVAPVVGDITINGAQVFPESVTHDSRGNLYNGSINGTIYRTLAGSGTAEPWILPNAQNGLTSLFGVLADERHGMLWVCNNPPFGGPPDPAAQSSLRGFDLTTGQLNAVFLMPAGKPAACNDIAVAADGSVWASETSGGRIFVLRPNANELELFAEGEELVGIDGLAFAEDGTLYINNVRRQKFQRVTRGDNGRYAGLTDLEVSAELGGPDGLRSLGGNRFLQAEGGSGRVALVDVSGNEARLTDIATGLNGSVGATLMGETVYVVEGKINYLFDPALKDQKPEPFIIRAIPLREGQ